MLTTLYALLFAAAFPATVQAGEVAVVEPVIENQAYCSNDPQIVVAITRFSPPRRGHAHLTVSLLTDGGRLISLGQAGIYPARAFTSSLPEAMRFSFSLPGKTLPEHPRIAIQVSTGDDGDHDAQAVIGEVRAMPAPQEQCTPGQPLIQQEKTA
jgi:hypothetical protein